MADGGYAWWYLDALSDDASEALTLIAFIGSVFSPYYASARRAAGRRAGTAKARNHVAMNAILYRPGGRRWSLTERDAPALRQDSHALRIGPSALSWRDQTLHVTIDEVTVPWPRRLRGRVRVMPEALNRTGWFLDPAGHHRWQPLAPSCRVEVEFDSPALRWAGTGYLDTNQGDEPLERGFRRWWWSRSHRGNQTLIQYETLGRDGSVTQLSLAGSAGKLSPQPPSPLTQLPATGWRVARSVRAAAPGVEVYRTLEDTPFYARSLLRDWPTGGHEQEPDLLLHEALDLDRFDSRWVQLLLPFRMPRRRWSG